MKNRIKLVEAENNKILIQVLPVLTQDESLYRALVALGNIIHCGQEEVRN